MSDPAARAALDASFEPDVIVVGSGSAGAVVARRLVDAGARSLLLEAGGPDQPGDPRSRAPVRALGQRAGLGLPDRAAGRLRRPASSHWPRGKVLGGSSALNGMIYVRGHRRDYDTWAYLGNEGWGYDDVLPLFKRSEDFDLGASDYHGRRAAARAVALRAAPRRSSRPRRRPASRSTPTTTASARRRRLHPAQHQGRRPPQHRGRVPRRPSRRTRTSPC